MAIHDLRNVNYSTDKFRALLPVTHTSVLAKLFIGREGAITKYTNDLENVKINYNIIDDSSANATIVAEETNTYNHYKYVPNKENFMPVLRAGVISGKAGKADMTALSGEALRIEGINFDKALLAGADGNKALLGFTADTLRKTVSPDALPEFTGSNYAACAEAARALGQLFREKIDATSMAESGFVVLYGDELKQWMAIRNTNTDSLTLMDEFRAGLDMPLAFIKVANRLLEGTALAATNGITFLGANQFEGDVAGESTFPTATVCPQEQRDSYAYDVVRIERGSAQVRPIVEGGMIGATITIEAESGS